MLLTSMGAKLVLCKDTGPGWHGADFGRMSLFVRGGAVWHLAPADIVIGF
jgi:hypothetical protein